MAGNIPNLLARALVCLSLLSLLLAPPGAAPARDSSGAALTHPLQDLWTGAILRHTQAVAASLAAAPMSLKKDGLLADRQQHRPHGTATRGPGLPRIQEQSAADAQASQSLSWQCDPTGGPACFDQLNSVAMVSATDGWAVGWPGLILHYNGSSWQRVSSPTTNALSSVSMVSASDGWAVGTNGTILRYGGTSWQSAPSPTGQSLYSVAIFSASDGWAVGTNGAVLHYGQSSTATPYYIYLPLAVRYSGGW